MGKEKTSAAIPDESFRDFFENAPIGCHIFGTDGIILDINRTELDKIGYKRDEIVGKKKWSDLIIPEEKAKFKNHWKDIKTKGIVNDIEYTLVHKDGHFINILLNASARLDKDGKLINTRGFILDITERNKNEKKYRSLVDQSLYGIIILQDFKIVFANRALLDVSGYSKNELLSFSSENIMKIFHPDDLPNLLKRYNDRIAGKKIQEISEFRVFKKDGSLVWVEISARLIEYDDKPAVQVIMKDISERKNAEIELIKYKTDLEATIKERTDEISRLATVIKQADVTVVITDLNGNIEYVNPNFAKSTGYTEEEAIGQNPRLLKSGYQDSGTYKKRVIQ